MVYNQHGTTAFQCVRVRVPTRYCSQSQCFRIRTARFHSRTLRKRYIRIIKGNASA